MSEIQDEYREYKKLCRVEDDPGVSGLAQLGRNAIERVTELERALAEREREKVDIAAALKDPVKVHVAMLKGIVAVPPLAEMLHIYGATFSDAEAANIELAKARETINRLRAENAALRADAERYRVIRDWPNRDGLELAIVSSLKVSMYGVSLDRVVDAARGVK